MDRKEIQITKNCHKYVLIIVHWESIIKGYSLEVREEPKMTRECVGAFPHGGLPIPWERPQEGDSLGNSEGG